MVGVMGIPRLQRFFEATASLETDRDDLKRYCRFVNEKIAGLMIRAQAVAEENGCDIIWLSDIPITRGLQECIQHFQQMHEQLEVTALLEHLAGLSQLHLDYSLETREALGDISGGLSVALAGTFRILDPQLRHPHGEQWERCFQIFSLLV